MPTVPVAYEASARNTYEARVRRALVALGSKDPDADIEATHAYLKHCKSLKLDPAVTAAGIYTTVHHRHEPTSVLRGAGEARKKMGGFEAYAREVEALLVKYGVSPGQASVWVSNHVALIQSQFDDGAPASSTAGVVLYFEKEGSAIPWTPRGASEVGGGYKDFDATTPEGPARKVQYYVQRHGYEMLGYPVPGSKGIWSVGVQFPDGSKSVITVPNGEVERVWDARATGAHEAPTGGEWNHAAVQIASANWAKANGLEYVRNSALPTGGTLSSGDGVWNIYVRSEPGGRAWVAKVPTKILMQHWHTSRANEAPTGGEWEVTIRRQGTIEKLVAAAGRKPDEIIGQNVMFGEFYDDEKAQAFAQKMMRAGYFSTYGPRRKVEAASGAAEAPRYGRRRWSEPDLSIELDTKRRAAYSAKVTSLTSGLTKISGEDLYQKHKVRPPETGRETVAVLSDAKTNEPRAILWKWEGWGYGESGGVSMVYWLLPGVLPGAGGAQERSGGSGKSKSSRAKESAPCNRLERGGVTGDCSALAKEIGPIETDKDLYRLFAPRMRKEPQEVFYVACVDVHGKLCAFSEIARGQVSSVHVTAAQVTQFVLSCKPMPTAYAVSHCHPGGHARPSEADKKLTADIIKSGREAMREVVFMDHIIIAGGESNREYYSFTDGKVKKYER
jgi:hypothetical protein